MTTIEIRTTAIVGWTAGRAVGGKWIAVCPPLAICVEGDSLDEIHSLIQEAHHALFLDLVEDNEFDDFLVERGWEAERAPVVGMEEDLEFYVPWELVVAGNDGSERRAH